MKALNLASRIAYIRACGAAERKSKRTKKKLLPEPTEVLSILITTSHKNSILSILTQIPEGIESLTFSFHINIIII